EPSLAPDQIVNRGAGRVHPGFEGVRNVEILAQLRETALDLPWRRRWTGVERGERPGDDGGPDSRRVVLLRIRLYLGAGQGVQGLVPDHHVRLALGLAHNIEERKAPRPPALGHLCKNPVGPDPDRLGDPATHVGPGDQSDEGVRPTQTPDGL